ncbi:hypothetical protein ACFWMR_01800 [Amycolatopsis thailandensis]|uniref:hypothetical protein n=1 Tax=Amycolatopsis thailandensis TaxID=589330 RepID=UPI00364B7393
MDEVRYPLAAESARTGGWFAGLSGLVGVAVVVGFITQDQANALNVTLVAIGALVTTVSPLLAAFGIRRKVEPLVTPVAEPRNDSGQTLTPAS